jgi:hypothetical protein
MPRRTRPRVTTPPPQTMSFRTRLAFGLLAFFTLVGTGLVVAPLALMG